MKVKIINSNLEDYQKELKLRRMNYDQVVVNYPGGKGIKVFDKLDVEFITESENILKLKINYIYFRTLIKTFSYLENYTGTENIEKYKIEVSNELKRKDIEIKGKLNILKLGFNIMPQLTSKVVQRLVNERER